MGVLCLEHSEYFCSKVCVPVFFHFILWVSLLFLLSFLFFRICSSRTANSQPSIAFLYFGSFVSFFYLLYMIFSFYFFVLVGDCCLHFVVCRSCSIVCYPFFFFFLLLFLFLFLFFTPSLLSSPSSCFFSYCQIPIHGTRGDTRRIFCILLRENFIGESRPPP